MEEYEDIYNSSSMITKGQYEILFGSFNYCNPDTNEEETDKAIQWLNGARVWFGGQLKYSIDYGTNPDTFRCINFTMPADDDKLGEIFESLPWGILKKNRTGVGATTLELKSPRHSIIVVPTRALALNKALRSLIEGTNKYKVLYVAGQTPGVKVPSIESYLADDTIEYKKFMVVIDSLPALLNVIGEEHYKDYFIMFDEVDTLQDSSWYRDRIENSFDYYFKFPFQNRCLVSATVSSFSNPNLKYESVINVDFNVPQPQNIVLQHVFSPLGRTKEEILKIHAAHPDENIVIALNLVTRGILPIIKELPEDVQAQCSILCGDSSIQMAGEYYREIEDGKLPSKITFMTNIYFVGIDIEERFHLICTADVQYPFTLLSVEKIQQIVGRCRCKEGVLSETIIYNTKAIKDTVNLERMEKELVENAQELADLSSLLKKVYSKYPKLNEGSRGIIDQDIMEASLKKYYYSDTIKIIRTKDDILLPTYFNIDNILLQNAIRATLYANKDQLKSALIRAGNNIVGFYECVNSQEAIQDDTYGKVEELKIITTEEERNNIIAQLRERDTVESRKNLALNLKTNCSRYNTLFVEHFIELQDYVPFERLVVLLNLYDKPREYARFKNGVIYWALAKNHPIKTALESNFKVEKFMQGEEIAEAFNAIYSTILGYKKLTPRQVFSRIRCWVSLSERTSTTIDGRMVNGYKVVNLNPYGLEGLPVTTIPKTENMNRVFRF